MDNLTFLQDIDLLGWFIITVGIVSAGVFLYKLFAKDIIQEHGIETAKMRQRREDHELLIKTSQNLALLQEKSEKDDRSLECALETFMEEVRTDIGELKDSIQQSYNNNLSYRQVSIEKEQRLNKRIDDMLESDKQRDKTVDEIGNGLNKLTNMFIDKQIADYRWSIINFATAISEKKPCTKEAFKHCFATYEKYEKILEENGLENGEVKISMEIINEAYKEKMLNGF